MHAPHIILAQRTRFHPIPICPKQPLLAGLAQLDSILKDLLNWYGSFFLINMRHSPRCSVVLSNKSESRTPKRKELS